MIILLTIFQYFIQATVDLMDKFLISTRKIEPVKYTFYTVVLGAALLVMWPWVFAAASAKTIALDLASGALFSLAMYVFFLCLSKGEASRVVPFVFGLVPVTDLFINFIFGDANLKISEISAVFLLVPGAMLISHENGKFWPRRAGLKVLSAVLFSCYYALWQYAAQGGAVLNNLIWNRLGAAAVLLAPLLFTAYRAKVFKPEPKEKKRSTTFLFLFKQLLGGLNFIFLSFLFVLGKIPVINSLQGFRYVFLFVMTYILSRHGAHLLKEQTDRRTLTQKLFGLALIFIGTALLFL